MSELCVGCTHYEPHGVTRGKRKYPKCRRPGAKELAMEERATGECGPNATKKE